MLVLKLYGIQKYIKVQLKALISSFVVKKTLIRNDVALSLIEITSI
jgi:hypothetical protein